MNPRPTPIAAQPVNSSEMLCQGGWWQAYQRLLQPEGLRCLRLVSSLHGRQAEIWRGNLDETLATIRMRFYVAAFVMLSG